MRRCTLPLPYGLSLPFGAGQGRVPQGAVREDPPGGLLVRIGQVGRHLRGGTLNRIASILNRITSTLNRIVSTLNRIIGARSHRTSGTASPEVLCGVYGPRFRGMARHSVVDSLWHCGCGIGSAPRSVRHTAAVSNHARVSAAEPIPVRAGEGPDRRSAASRPGKAAQRAGLPRKRVGRWIMRRRQESADGVCTRLRFTVPSDSRKATA